MKPFAKLAAIGAFAVSVALSATSADALPFALSGTFQITAYNYAPSGTDAQRSAQSQATAANFAALVDGTLGVTNVTSSTFSYTGALDFRAARDVTPNPMTIGAWLATASGNLDGITDLDPTDNPFATFASKTLSAGAGGSDAGAPDGNFRIATLFKITATSLNIGDLANLWNVRHDDGVTVLGADNTSVKVPGPRSESSIPTNLFGELNGGVSDFTLYYAAANGNPSVLEVQAVPLPAAAWLLLAVSGGLVAAKRRGTRRAA
jgi:hypothetical protein